MWPLSTIFAKTGPTHFFLLLIFFTLVSGCALLREDGQEPVSADSIAGNEAQAVNPELQLRFQQIVTLIRNEQFEEAVTALESFIADDASLASPHVNLGIAYVRLGREGDAMNAFQAALAVDPNDPHANNLLGILHRQAGRFEEARASYQKILAAHPDYGNAHLNMGILCDIYLQNLNCALGHYEKFQQLSAAEDKEVSLWITDLKQRMRSKQASAP
ncbi:MAG: tetratricopeptide repeat protein [Gammaproteobacteria bacterium]